MYCTVHKNALYLQHTSRAGGRPPEKSDRARAETTPPGPVLAAKPQKRPARLLEKKTIENRFVMNRQTYKDLIRPTDDRIIAGVCAGLADFFGLDSSTVRLATLLLILFGGLSLWVYIILWIIVPSAPRR